MAVRQQTLDGAPRPVGADQVGRARLWLQAHRIAVLAIGGILVFYVATRLAVLWRFPPYYDESAYAAEAQQALLQPALRFVSLYEDKGPLLLWLSFVPLKLGFAPLTSVRLVGQVSGLWTLAMVALTTHRLAGGRTALVAMALFVVIPLWLVFTAIGFHEPLVTAAGMSALYIHLRLADSRDLRSSLELGVLLGLALGVGLLTKETGKYYVVLVPTGLLLVPWEQGAVAYRLTRWLAGAAVAVIVGYALYSIERLSPIYYELGHIRTHLHEYTALHTALSELGPILQRNWPGYRVELDVYLTVPLLLAAAVGAGIMLSRWPRRGLFFLLWIIPPLAAVVLIASRPIGHYLLPAVTPTIVLMAIGVTECWRALRSRVSRPRLRALALAVLAIAALAPSLWFDGHFIADPSRMKLPAYDDRELIDDAAAGSGLSQFVSIIRKRSKGRAGPQTLAFSGAIIANIPLMLGDPSDLGVVLEYFALSPRASRYPYVSLQDPAAANARYVLAAIEGFPPSCSIVAPGTTPGSALSNPAFPAGTQVPLNQLRLISTYQRPRGGDLLCLYERVAAVAESHLRGRSSAELRLGASLGDRFRTGA